MLPAPLVRAGWEAGLGAADPALARNASRGCCAPRCLGVRNWFKNNARRIFASSSRLAHLIPWVRIRASLAGPPRAESEPARPPPQNTDRQTHTHTLPLPLPQVATLFRKCKRQDPLLQPWEDDSLVIKVQDMPKGCEWPAWRLPRPGRAGAGASWRPLQNLDAAARSLAACRAGCPAPASLLPLLPACMAHAARRRLASSGLPDSCRLPIW